MQMPPGKKTDEVKIYIDEHNNNVWYNVHLDSHQIFHIEIMKTSSINCNILILSAVLDYLNETTFVPAQQLQKKLQINTNAAKCKVTKSFELTRKILTQRLDCMLLDLFFKRLKKFKQTNLKL